MLHGHSKHVLFDYLLEAVRNSHTMNKNVCITIITICNLLSEGLEDLISIAVQAEPLQERKVIQCKLLCFFQWSQYSPIGHNGPATCRNIQDVSAVQLLNFQCFNTDLNQNFRQFCQIHSLQ